MNAINPPPVIARPGANVPLPRLLDLTAIPPALRKHEATPRRTRIWEFAGNLHCSIIGTCLSATELRGILRKLGLAAPDASDHDLHKLAVGIAGQPGEAARSLHKALDNRHKLTLHQFARADSEAGLLASWREAARRGDIPGAYWATLTHRLATQAVIREAFGEVHMLSHLVGSANRADLRRLQALEDDKAALQAKLDRQQAALHEAVATRDRQINDLRQALAERILAHAPSDNAGLSGLVADRERRLEAQRRHGAAMGERLAAARAERDRERSARCLAEGRAAALEEELAVIEASLDSHADEAERPVRLHGQTLLYVGGRPGPVARLKPLTEGFGGAWLHHDGGIEDHPSLLAGLVSRCDIAAFPVDCISHDAALNLKALCRNAGKPFLPLRSAGIGSLLAALRGLDTAATAAVPGGVPAQAPASPEVRPTAARE